MYLEHFGLTRKPFSLTPDPAFMYLSERHSIAYAMLEYGVYEQAGLTVLTGDVGMGKTTLLHRLLNNVDKRRLTVGNIYNTHAAFGSLLEWACVAFGLPIENDRPVLLFQALQNFLISEYAKGRRCLLVVDEAQNLSIDQLEQVRLLSNINSGDDLLLHILLVGQAELHEHLFDARLVQLVQRITSEYRLEPFDFNTTINYILHRLKIAGVEHRRGLFGLDAMAAVHHYSLGIPRTINKLCDYGLMVAFARQEECVTLEALIEVLMAQNMGGRERQHLGPLDAGVIRKTVRQLVQATWPAQEVETHAPAVAGPATVKTPVDSSDPPATVDPAPDGKVKTPVSAPAGAVDGWKEF